LWLTYKVRDSYRILSVKQTLPTRARQWFRLRVSWPKYTQFVANIQSSWIIYRVRDRGCDSFTQFVGSRLRVSWLPFIEFVTCIQNLSLIYRVHDAYTEFVWHNTEIVKHMQRVLSVCDAYTEFVTYIQSSWLIYTDREAYAEGTVVNGISVISHEIYELLSYSHYSCSLWVNS